MSAAVKARLFLGNVAYGLDEATLTHELATLGIAVENVKIARHKETGQSRGFAFIDVDFARVDEALVILNGAQIGQRTLQAERAATQPGEDRSPGGGSSNRRGGRRAGGGGDRDGRRDADVWRDDRQERRPRHRRW